MLRIAVPALAYDRLVDHFRTSGEVLFFLRSLDPSEFLICVMPPAALPGAVFLGYYYG